ncbi:hypothetical protein GQ54DRAFT_306163 [Martensiomyces pterosporus]|nr:hypothetical protein GQ54DRAFT_306163 [Martensiomyces pterosporus]
MDTADLSLNQLRERQVAALTRALGQFVSLKSSAEGWTPVLPVGGSIPPGSVGGGDVSVQLGKKIIVAADGKASDIYRLSASIPLDPEISRDTQGPFSAYLSELRDWQAVLECPGIRSMWNYYLSSSSTLEMLDAHTSITRSILRSPVPGRSREFAHQRDMLMVETSLVDPTTVVYISTSLSTNADDPVYLRERGGFKRVQSDLWAWCVEIATPLDALSGGAGQQQRAGAASGGQMRARKPRVCVQVTCFLHLDLGSWKSNNALACRAAAQLIPSLVAHLRLHGAPPRLARIGPSIVVDRRDWSRRGGQETADWEVAYSVMGASCADDVQANDGSNNPPAIPGYGSAHAIGQPIISRIIDLETAGGTHAHGVVSHARKVSSLSSYLSSSLQRQKGEAVLGTHAGGIVRDGEELALVVTRARLGDCILEFVVDASHWHSEGRAVELTLSVAGFASIEQLQASIGEVHSAAPELFTKAQVELTLEEFLESRRASANTRLKSDSANESALGMRLARRHARDRSALAELAARQLVRCFSIASQKNARHRYLVRVMNPPMVASSPVEDSVYVEDSASSLTNDTQVAGADGETGVPDKVYRVSMLVRKGKECKEASVFVNGCQMEIAPFSLDPTAYPARLTTKSSSATVKLPVSRSDPGLANRSSSRSATPALALRKQEPQAPTAATPDIGDSSDGPVGEARRTQAAPESTANEGLTPPTDGSSEQSRQEPANDAPNAPDGGSIVAPSDMEMQDVPFVRLCQACRVPASQWTSLGSSASGGVTLSKTEIAQNLSDLPPGALAQGTTDNSSSDGEGDGSDSAHGAAAATAQHGITGVVLRAEASIVGWTIFDVFSVLSNGSLSGSASGLWTESHMIEQISPSATLYRCASESTWTTSARDAIVCSSWSTASRGRIEVAECSVAESEVASIAALPSVKASNPVRADLGLSGWVLEKSTLAEARAVGSSDRHTNSGSAVARMSFGLLSSGHASASPSPSAADALSQTPAHGRLRSDSVTGSPAIDAEFENQRRKQQVVKVTHYLKYNPRGWVNPTAMETQGDGEGVATAFQRFGAALGISPQTEPDAQAHGEDSNEPAAPAKQREKPIFPFILLPGSKDALARDITRVISHLDSLGAPPTAVWSRNANLLDTQVAQNSVQFTYRMVPWGTARRPYGSSSSPASSTAPSLAMHRRRLPSAGGFLGSSAMSALPASAEDSEFVETEFRIEHRVWAYGVPADGQERTSPASIDLTVEPFYATSAIACFVDPELDPHATRVRIRHHRSQLLPRVEESSNAMFMVWPTVRLTVARRDAKKQRAKERGSSDKAASSLVLPAGGGVGTSASARVLPWSVPPRVAVNGAAARVRYLRRDDGSRGFYARCLSVSSHDFTRIMRAPPPVGEHYMEQLHDTTPAQDQSQSGILESQEGGPLAQGSGQTTSSSAPDDEAGQRRSLGASSLAIRNYSVVSSNAQASVGRVVEVPNEFATIMARMFADIRHELELLDQSSPRSRWEQLKAQYYDADARSLVSLRTAVGDDSWWSRRQSGDVVAFERTMNSLHPEIPVTVAVAVLQGVSAEQVAQVVGTLWGRSKWDHVLFSHQRELEYVPDSHASMADSGSDETSAHEALDPQDGCALDASCAGGVTINYSTVHAPLLCGKRDALTVELIEQAAFLPTRKRMRNWQHRHTEPSSHGKSGGGCASRLGDYLDSTITLIESSVPGSQPLSTVTRASIPLYAMRIDPIDGFERVSGHRFEYPSCRLTIACCFDLCGSVPLPLRRSTSSRIPEQHIAQIKALAQKPLPPYLASPTRHRRLGPCNSYVLGEVSEEVVGGRKWVFRRTFDGTRVVHESFDDSTRTFMSVVSLLPPDAVGVQERLDGLLNHGDESAADANPAVPVVSDCIVDRRCFPQGYRIYAALCTGSEISAPIDEGEGWGSKGGQGVNEGAVHGNIEVVDIASGCWTDSSSSRASEADLCGRRLGVFVFALDDDTAPLAATSRPDGNVRCERRHLVRVVLLPSEQFPANRWRRGGDEAGSLACRLVIQPARDETKAQTTKSAIAGDSTDARKDRASFGGEQVAEGGARVAVNPCSADKGAMTISCNGQQVRVHKARPKRQSLLFIETTSGPVDVCRECSELGCSGYKRIFRESAADASSDDHISDDLVSLGSDCDEGESEASSLRAAARRTAADAVGTSVQSQGDARTAGNTAAGRQSTSEARHSAREQGISSVPLAVGQQQQQIPSPVSVAAKTSGRENGPRASDPPLFSVSAVLRQRKSVPNKVTAAAGKGPQDTWRQLSPALRKRGNSNSSSASGGDRVAKEIVGRSSTAKGSSGYMARAGVAAAVAQGALFVLSLAVFLPVRRLVLGSASVEQWLLWTANRRGGAGAGPRKAAKSTVFLLLVLLAGAACVVLGEWLAVLSYAWAF